MSIQAKYQWTQERKSSFKRYLGGSVDKLWEPFGLPGKGSILGEEDAWVDEATIPSSNPKAGASDQVWVWGQER